MITKIKVCYFVLMTLFFAACSNQKQTNTALLGTQIAFMADVHLQDIYGKFQDNDYKGIINPANSKYIIARTMEAQINSTRIFNENYFAFLVALNDVAKRNIKYVVLPGDFSDDGQPINVRGLKNILDHYTKNYDIRFIATTGNHDPVRPFSLDAGKIDFLGEGGKPQAIMSKEGMYVPKTSEELPVVITQDIRTMGYQEIISTLDNCGFFPQKNDLYWETPFTTYNFDSYNYEEAKLQSALEYRNYSIAPNNTRVPDVSYLIEPMQDLWFLAIDANVYILNKNDVFRPYDIESFSDASIGYNHVLTHKKHLIKWVKKVTDEAKKRGKTLIAFSHYPMVDFNDDATPHLKAFLEGEKMQVHRVPEENVAQIFADAGIRVHFGGHMHINDTGVRKSKKGNTLVNVQIPSLAAYIPAYKILTIQNQQLLEIETVVLDSVPRFNELFPIYEKEYDYLQSMGKNDIWDRDILNAKTYHEFTNLHLKGLVRNRFLKTDWPIEFRNFVLNSSGKELLEFAAKADAVMPQQTNELENWTGFDMIFDFYRLRSADKLAIDDIGLERIQQYQIITDSFITKNKMNLPASSSIYNDFREFANSFHHFLNGAPANHFQINLQTGEVRALDDATHKK